LTSLGSRFRGNDNVGLDQCLPNGSLRVAIRAPERVNRYAFGTKTAEFHVCTVCGVVLVVTSHIDGRTYAVVGVNAFEDVNPSILRRASASFDGEGEGERLARRARNWIPEVRFERNDA
jgi:hypothetical protein